MVLVLLAGTSSPLPADGGLQLLGVVGSSAPGTATEPIPRSRAGATDALAQRRPTPTPVPVRVLEPWIFVRVTVENRDPGGWLESLFPGLNTSLRDDISALRVEFQGCFDRFIEENAGSITRSYSHATGPWMGGAGGAPRPFHLIDFYAQPVEGSEQSMFERLLAQFPRRSGPSENGASWTITFQRRDRWMTGSGPGGWILHSPESLSGSGPADTVP